MVVCWCTPATTTDTIHHHHLQHPDQDHTILGCKSIGYTTTDSIQHVGAVGHPVKCVEFCICPLEPLIGLIEVLEAKNRAGKRDDCHFFPGKLVLRQPVFVFWLFPFLFRQDSMVTNQTLETAIRVSIGWPRILCLMHGEVLVPLCYKSILFRGVFYPIYLWVNRREVFRSLVVDVCTPDQLAWRWSADIAGNMCFLFSSGLVPNTSPASWGGLMLFDQMSLDFRASTRDADSILSSWVWGSKGCVR